MARFRDYKPDDPFYREGPRSCSPHWGRTLLDPKKSAPPDTAEPQPQQPTEKWKDND